MRKAIIISIFLLAACKHEQPQQSTTSATIAKEEPPIVRDEVFYPPSSNSSSPGTVVKNKDHVPFKEEQAVVTQQEPVLPIPPIHAADRTSFVTLAEEHAPTQGFLIDQTNFSIITGAQGTRLTIPPSVFMLNDSTPYEGSVRIELREVYDQSQMIFANFSTTSNGEPLESAGMIYWDATTEYGMPLQLDSGASISVEMPRTLNASDYKLFAGSINDGMMDWQLLPVPSASLQLAIVPYGVFHFNKFRISKKLKGIDRHIRNDWNDQIESLASGDFEKTPLCTKEFLRRIERAKWMGWNSEILSIYLSNSSDLHYADSLALIQVAEYGVNIKGSSWSLSKKYFATGSGKKSWLKESTKAFRVFYEESKFYDQNIFLALKDIRGKKQLANKGIEESYADWLVHPVLLRYNHISHGYDLVDRPRQIAATSIVKSSGSSFVTLKVPTMGYLNCDRFLLNTKKEDIIVRIENFNEMDNISATLIFKNLNSMVSGFEVNGVVTFNAIPVNCCVYWLVIGTKDGQLYSASSKLLPEQFTKEATKEMLRPTTKEELEKAIKDFTS